MTDLTSTNLANTFTQKSGSASKEASNSDSDFRQPEIFDEINNGSDYGILSKKYDDDNSFVKIPRAQYDSLEELFEDNFGKNGKYYKEEKTQEKVKEEPKMVDESIEILKYLGKMK